MQKNKTNEGELRFVLFTSGAPEWIRTIGTERRRLVLYPAELQVRIAPATMRQPRRKALGKTDDLSLGARQNNKALPPAHIYYMPFSAVFATFMHDYLTYAATIFLSISTTASISCTAIYSFSPCAFLPPVQILGQGSPMNDS